LLRLKDAARYLSMSCGKLRAIIQRGELSVIKSDGASPWLLDTKDLDLWIERSKVTL
jgi:excisionase family DNA binding protein